MSASQEAWLCECGAPVNRALCQRCRGRRGGLSRKSRKIAAVTATLRMDHLHRVLAAAIEARNAGDMVSARAARAAIVAHLDRALKLPDRR